MPRYACLDKDNNILWSDRYFDKQPQDPIGKGWRIVPVEEEKPNYDPETYFLVLDNTAIEDGKVKEIYRLEPVPTPLPDPLEVKMAELEARIAALELARATKV